MLDLTQKPKVLEILEKTGTLGLKEQIFLGDWNNRLSSTLGHLKHPNKARPFYLIELNPKTWEKLSPTGQFELLCHEICHATAHFKVKHDSFLLAQNRQYAGHGFQWVRDMQSLGLAANRYACGLNVERRRQTRFQYICNCGKQMKLSSTIRNRIQSGRYSYRCKSCGTLIRREKIDWLAVQVR